MQSAATKILQAKGIPFRLIRLLNKSISSDDVIKNAVDDLNPAEICKTIIAKDESDNFYAIILPGKSKIDFSKAQNIIGQKISIIEFDDVEKITGQEPGAITPITLDIPILVDHKVFQTEKINFGSSDQSFGLEVSTNDLEKIFAFQRVDISQ